MDVEREVCELLRPFGITEKYIGVSQLALALQILLENPECIHAVQKRVYMEISEVFCVNWKTIERNIRTLSTVAMRTDPQYLELLAQYPLTKRPTAVQLIMSRVMRKFCKSLVEIYYRGRVNRPLVTSQRSGRKGSRAAVRRSSCP